MDKSENRDHQSTEVQPVKLRSTKHWPYRWFLIIFSFVLYGNTVSNEYAIDDTIVADNELAQQGINAIPEIFTSRYRVTEKYNYGYRPIVKSTFAIEHELFGRNPHIGHFINVLLYAFIGLILFYLFGKLLKGYNVLFPFIITVLFMAHPVHTEAVASLKNREELLSFLGCLVSLCFFIKYTENKRIRHILFGLFFYLFAYLSKQNAIAFAVVIPLTIYFFSDTSFDLKFLRIAGKVLTPITLRVKHFFLQKSTSLMTGLLCYFTALFGWHFDFYIYLTLFIIPAVFLFIRYYVLANPSHKPLLKNLSRNITFWVFVMLYIALVAVKQSPYVYQSDIRTIYEVGVVLGIVFLSWYLYKVFTPHIGVGTFPKKLYLSGVGLFYYCFPHLHIDVALTILAGIIPILLYAMPAVTASESLPSIKAVTTGTELGWRDFVGSFSSSMKLFFLLTVILGIASYAFLVAPDEYLPAEQRELHYFENPLFYMSEWWLNIATALYSLLIYLKLLIYPHPLVFYYGYNHVPIVDFFNGWVILSVVLHLSLFIYAVVKFRQKHVVSFAILYYLLTIFIYSNLVLKIPGIVGERLLFMPSLGFCIVVAYLAFKILKIDPKSKMLSKALMLKLLLVTGLLVIPYTIKTIVRNADWKNHTTLYLHDIPYLKNSLHANSLVASQMLRNIVPNPQSQAESDKNRERLELVVKHFEQVLIIDPREVKTLNNLGRVQVEFYQSYGKAVKYFERAIKLEPATAEAMFNIALCYEKLDRIPTAKSAYLESIKIDSIYVNSISGLANVYFRTGMRDSALYLNDRLADIDPLLDLPYINVGNYYLQMNKEAEAVGMFEKAVELNPGNLQLAKALADYFKEQSDQSKVKYYTNLYSGSL